MSNTLPNCVHTGMHIQTNVYIHTYFHSYIHRHMHINTHSYKNRYYTFIHAYIIHIYISHSMDSIRSYIIIHVYQLRRRSFHLPNFCITVRNLIITLDEGLIRTWRFPRFSALYIFFSASFNTLILTMSQQSLEPRKKKVTEEEDIKKEVRDGGGKESKNAEKREMEIQWP